MTQTECDIREHFNTTTIFEYIFVTLWSQRVIFTSRSVNAFWLLDIWDGVCANLCIGFVVTGFRDKRDKDTFEYYLSLQSQNRRRCKMSGLNFWLFLSPPNNITLDSNGISMEFRWNFLGTSMLGLHWTFSFWSTLAKAPLLAFPCFKLFTSTPCLLEPFLSTFLFWK